MLKKWKTNKLLALHVKPPDVVFFQPR